MSVGGGGGVGGRGWRGKRVVTGGDHYFFGAERGWYYLGGWGGRSFPNSAVKMNQLITILLDVPNVVLIQFSNPPKEPLVSVKHDWSFGASQGVKS